MRDFPVWSYAIDSRSATLIRKDKIVKGDPYSTPYFITDLFAVDSNATEEDKVTFDDYFDFYKECWEKLANADANNKI